MYPKKLAHVHQETGTGLLMAALFVIAEPGDDPRVINRKVGERWVATQWVVIRRHSR